MKLVMGTTKRGNCRHLVNSEDLAVGLCGCKIEYLTRRMDDQSIVMFSEHWLDEAVSGDELMCSNCMVKAGFRRGSDVYRAAGY